jgi:hypothetical protein
MNYCGYCGSSYINMTCEICYVLFPVCACNFSQSICNECELELEEMEQE